MGIDRTAVVWAATWVPSPSPIRAFGPDGYAVCWADVDDGRRVQVLVDGGAPPPGAVGTIRDRRFGDLIVEVFEGEGA